MSTFQKMDVNVNIAQDFSDTQKAQARTNIGAAAASDLSTLAESVAEFTDTKVVQTKDDSGTYPIDISGNAATATATSSGAIQGGDDLNSYNVANRTYLCSAANATTVTNKPAGASGAFELEVIRGTGSTCVQVYYSRDDVNFNYIRKCTGLDTWTSWVKMFRNPFTATAEIAYNDSTETTLATIGGIVISCHIQSEAYVQLKLTSSSSRFVTAFSETLKAGDNATVNNYPSLYSFSNPSTSVYTGYLYNANNISFQETRFCLEDGSLTTLRVTCVFENSTYKFHFQLF